MTRTVFIDAAQYPTAKALHRALQMMLELPDYYGCNADALYDCLSERRETVNAVVMRAGEGETADALKKCLCVIEDLGGDVKVL